MSEQTMDSTAEGLVPVAVATATAEAREQVQKALERAAREGVRAAVILLEVNPNYADRANERVLEVLADWQRRRAGRLYVGSLAPNRFLLMTLPIGLPAHARALADRLTRSLDPRICPSLRRALPYAWSGVSLFPDDGCEADLLMARAEQSMERNRASAARRRNPVLSRRRLTAAGLLSPAVAR